MKNSMGKSLRDGIYAPVKLRNNFLASCFLRKFDFWLLHTAYFDKSIILPFLIITTLGYLRSVFFLPFKQYDNIVLYIV